MEYFKKDGEAEFIKPNSNKKQLGVYDDKDIIHMSRSEPQL
jgi:hypothetical protein